MAEMPDESVDCIVTSPPYYGLRDYGVAGQIGCEKTPQEHIQVLVDLFHDARRVLKKTGTLWLNYGDCYASSVNGRSAAATKAAGTDDRTFRDKPFSTVGGIFKPKDLMMMPSRLAIAMHADGWWLRSEIVWAKPNPMPESVTDRPACSHEKMFLFTKSERYFYDADAVKRVPERPDWMYETPTTPGNKDRQDGGCTQRKPKTDKQTQGGRRYSGFNARWDEKEKTTQAATANLRNVWNIATAPFPESHFATFPPDLVEPCIKAGCPVGGLVLDPFGGAGTVGLVADRLQRNSILFELNPEYAAISERRLRKDGGMFLDLKVA
jgi:DNA modification methylase